MYKSLYECECEFLTRKLPFRADFEQRVLDDIQKKYRSSERLVYVSQGPGGFLSDFVIIQKLLAAGYSNLELVFIEPLLVKNLTILQACLDFKEWWAQQKNKGKIHVFMSIKEYAAACEQDENMLGHVFITIDPDDKKTVPNFESATFRKKFGRMAKNILHPEATFYYLYFQKVAGNPYRHMIIGQIQEKCILLDHWFGVETFEKKHIANYPLSSSRSL